MRVIWLWNTHLCASRWVTRKHPHPAQREREKKSRVAQKPSKEALCEHSCSSRSKRTARKKNPFSSFNTRGRKRWRANAFWTRVSWPRNRADLTTVSCVTHFLVPPKTLVFFSNFNGEFYFTPHASNKRILINKSTGNWFFLSSFPGRSLTPVARLLPIIYIGWFIWYKSRKEFWIWKWFGNWVDDAVFWGEEFWSFWF